MTKMIDADAILKRAEPLAHQHVPEIQRYGHLIRMGETVILVGLEPGPHRVLFELADPTHRVITTQTVAFTVPTPQTP